MKLEQERNLGDCNSFGIAVRCRGFVRARTVDELREAVELARHRSWPFLVLGEGSNVLLVDDFPGLVIRLDMVGCSIHDSADARHAIVHAAAGENWHELVRSCLEQELYGLENLALIPGSVGAAPVQNIGAYGVELSDWLESVDVFDLETLQRSRMSAAECELAYRDSIFKRALRDRVIILAITLKLSRQAEPHAEYPSLGQYMQKHALALTPRNVFESVCAVRRSRLPDPATLGNAGSFFRNPIVSLPHFEQLRARYPDMPGFTVAASDGEDDTLVKVPAAWLIERCGWKGFRRGDAGVHGEQALVLVNHGGASGRELLGLARDVAASVEERFGVGLVPEVRIIAGGGESPL